MKLLLYPKGLLEVAWRKDKKLYYNMNSAIIHGTLNSCAHMQTHTDSITSLRNIFRNIFITTGQYRRAEI